MGTVGAGVAGAEALARAAAATVCAGEGAVGDTLRAAALRALRACVAARPPVLTPVLASLLPHAGSSDVADVLVASLKPAFAAAAATAAAVAAAATAAANPTATSAQAPKALGVGDVVPGAMHGLAQLRTHHLHCAYC